MKTRWGTWAAAMAAAICPGVRLVDGRREEGREEVCVTTAFRSFATEATWAAVEEPVD